MQQPHTEPAPSTAAIRGHPIHPMLVVLPLGLLSTAVVFDVAYVMTANADLAIVAFWMIAAGLVGGVLAALFGLIDWLAIPDGTRAKAVGLTHGIGNAVIVVPAAKKTKAGRPR